MSDTDQRQEQNPQSPVPAPRILGELAADLRSLIDTTRLRVARTVNAELVMLYWEIGEPDTARYPRRCPGGIR